MLSLLLAAALAAPNRAPADYALLQGRVIVVTRAAHAVAIAVDTNNDGYADDLFWFFAASAPPLRVYSEKASLEFRGDEVIVVTGDTGELYSFTAGTPRLAQRGQAGPASSVFGGYGLNHMMGPRVNAIYMPSPRVGRIHANDDDCGNPGCIYYLDSGDGGTPGGSCDAGGAGATSCSVSQGSDSCSVSCVAGDYACCKRSSSGFFAPTCSCIRY